jgi:hypothetical protein
MLLVRKPKVMGDLTVRGWLYALGGASTVDHGPLHRGDARQPVFVLRPSFQ